LVLKVLVTEANVPERDGAEWLLSALGEQFSRLKLIWVDGGFSGKEFIERIQQKCQLTLQFCKESVVIHFYGKGKECNS
jgi:putative transposase